MLMAKLFQELERHSDFPFEVKYLLMNPGYNEANLNYTKENLNELLYKIADTLDNTEEFDLFEDDEFDFVEYNFEEEKKPFEIEKQSDGVFNVYGDKIEKLFQMTDFDSDIARARFARMLRSIGVDDKLRELGVKNGDTVRIIDFEFEFID